VPILVTDLAERTPFIWPPTWYDSEAGEAATRGDHKTLYRIVKELTGQRMQSQQIKVADGKFDKTHDELVSRW